MCDTPLMTPAQPIPANSAQRGVAAAAQLRVAEPAVAVQVARQLKNAGLSASVVSALATADPAGAGTIALIAGVADLVEAEGLPRIRLRWNADGPAPYTGPPPPAPPVKVTRTSSPSPDRYQPGTFNSPQSERGANARLVVARTRVTTSDHDSGWRTELRFETAGGTQSVKVPNDQSVIDVLDDLSAQGWALLAVVVEESAIVSGSGVSEKSTPIRAAHYLRRTRGPADKGGADR